MKPDNMYGRAHIGGLYEVEEALGRGVPLPASEGVWWSAGSSPLGSGVELQEPTLF